MDERMAAGVTLGLDSMLSVRILGVNVLGEIICERVQVQLKPCWEMKLSEKVEYLSSEHELHLYFIYLEFQLYFPLTFSLIKL